jgi:hypothetical protein
LEKFRFVLDYKIKELKLQIAPREHEINTMRKQIEEMNIELEQYQKSNLALNLMIDELKLKIDGIKGEFNLQEERCAISNRFLEKFCADLQDLWLHKNDIHLFKQKVIKMYRIYVQEEMNEKAQANLHAKKSGGKKGGSSSSKKGGSTTTDLEDPQQIYNRDREQMERSLDSLRRAMKTETIAHKRDLSKMMRESVMLTKELNTLRKNARSLLLQKKAIEQAFANNELTSIESVYEIMELLGLPLKKEKIPTAAIGTSGSNQLPTASTNQTSGINPPAPPAVAPGAIAANAMDAYSRSRRNQMLANTRSAALRTTSADGTITRANDAGGDGTSGSPSRAQSRHRHNQSRQDQWEAWREIQIQYDTMKVLEDQLTSLCDNLGLDPIPILVTVDSQAEAPDA